MISGCPWRGDPDYAECTSCKIQAQEKKEGGKRRRSLERRAFGGGSRGGKPGGHSKGRKLVVGGTGFVSIIR